MNGWHGCLAMVLLIFAPLSAAHGSAIYKCTIHGSTAYQDKPCSPGKPEVGRLSGPTIPAGDQAPTNSPAALMRSIRDVTDHGRQLHNRYDRELDQLRASMTGVTDEQTRRQQVGEFNRGWQQRFTENRRQQQDLLQHLRQLCPHGASGGSGKTVCHR